MRNKSAVLTKLLLKALRQHDASCSPYTRPASTAAKEGVSASANRADEWASDLSYLGNQFTCFTGTKVQTLTQKALLVGLDEREEDEAAPGTRARAASECGDTEGGGLSRSGGGGQAARALQDSAFQTVYPTAVSQRVLRTEHPQCVAIRIGRLQLTYADVCGRMLTYADVC